MKAAGIVERKPLCLWCTRSSDKVYPVLLEAFGIKSAELRHEICCSLGWTIFGGQKDIADKIECLLTASLVGCFHHDTDLADHLEEQMML